MKHKISESKYLFSVNKAEQELELGETKYQRKITLEARILRSHTEFETISFEVRCGDKISKVAEIIGEYLDVKKDKLNFIHNQKKLKHQSLVSELSGDNKHKFGLLCLLGEEWYKIFARFSTTEQR